MIDVIEQIETDPASWPAKPAGLSTGADALAPAFVWSKLETRMAWRWGVRTVEWIIEGGPGPFDLPLRPAEVTLTEAWSGEAWETVTLAPTARGGVHLSSRAPYRITATVGDAEAPPALVLEAYRRYAEYIVELEGAPVPSGVLSHSIDLGGVKESMRFDPWRRAQALDQSGAGDLLRIYRRA